jgi:hypothetical protein
MSALFSQSFRMRAAYASQASLNIFWFQILIQLFIVLGCRLALARFMTILGLLQWRAKRTGTYGER